MSSLLSSLDHESEESNIHKDQTVYHKDSNMGLSWKNVDIEVLNNNKRYDRKRIKLVSNASGHIESGMLAIMGPSGSGKTTLLNAFVGRVPDGSCTTGQILFNGKNRDNSWTSTVGFVDQDDTIYETLTARETIEYSAKFRLKNKQIDVDKKIDYIAKKLGIFHILKNKMKSVSGGERKRVMVAVELITDPQTIFLDEPTSGLDNNTALKLIKLLKSISDEGKLIILTIHQPDDLTVMEFEKLLLLSQGRSVYMGDFKKCQSHMESTGIRRGEYETFSNFAMKTLDIEPGLYHESSSNPILDQMVSEVVAKYGTDETEKIKKFSNELRLNYRFSFQDFLILFKRRFKLYLLTKKIIFTQMIICLFTAYILYKSKDIDPIWEDLIFPLPLRVLLKNLNIHSAHLSKEDLLLLHHPADFFVHILLRFPFIFAMAPIYSGSAFTSEHSQVKREIGVDSYSILSYYLAVLVSEYTMCSPPILIIFFGSFYVFKERLLSIIDVSLSLSIYIAIIPLYLLAGSFFKNHKLSQVVTTILVIFCVLPITVFIIILTKILLIDQEARLWHTAFDFLPNHLIIVLSSLIYGNKLRNSISEIVKKKYTGTKTNLELAQKTINTICDQMNETLVQTVLYKLNYSFLIYTLLIFLLSLYVGLTLLFLGFNLRQHTRFKLNG